VLRTAQREGWLRPREIDGHVQTLPVVVLSAVRVSPRRLAEFRPLAYLPKPFPIEALLRLAAEAAERRNGGVVTEQEDEEHASTVLPDEEELHA
jgi:DNA-binding response OmpR family regulator